MGTHADILTSLLMELNRFDQRLGHIVRANRDQIAATNERIADSFEQIASRERPRLRVNGSFLSLPPSRSS